MSKQLLFSITKKDFEIQTFRSGGKGGQKQNKTDSGCRIIHKESGARGECRNFRSQHQNKREALKRLVQDKRFKLWINRKYFELKDKETIEEKVEKEMNSSNLKIECKNEDNQWDECLSELLEI